MIGECFFNGSIDLLASQSVSGRKKLVSYHHIKNMDKSIGEVLMYKFKQLKFPMHEKKLLTRDIRMAIYAIQNFETKKIYRDLSHLLRMIKSIKDPIFTVKANEYGGFVCLAALFSRELPKNQQIIFNLQDIPLALFPKKIYKNKKNIQSNHKILLSCSKHSWLNGLDTLLECPSKMPLSSLMYDPYYEQIAA